MGDALYYTVMDAYRCGLKVSYDNAGVRDGSTLGMFLWLADGATLEQAWSLLQGEIRLCVRGGTGR